MSSSAPSEDGIIRLTVQRLQQFGGVDITSHGASMYPFIKAGDNCHFAAVLPEALQPGDVVLYQTDSGELIGHRLLYKRFVEGPTLQFVFKGDTNRHPDPPVGANSILARLVTVTRPRFGRVIDVESRPRRFWTWSIITIPLVSSSCRTLVVQRAIWKHRFATLRRLMKLE